jgi:pilus assembly protein CpaB
MTRRIVAITVAIVLAALGAAGGLFLILTADQRAQDALENGVTVAVAKAPITVGTTGARVRAQDLIKLVRLPQANVPDDALTDFGPAYDKLVVQSNIAANQIMLKGNFGSAAAATNTLPLPDGMLAVTVQTGAPQQVAGYVHPGSQIAIFLTYQVVGPAGQKTGIQRTRVLLPRVTVMAIGQDSGKDPSTTTGSNSLLVTVAVNPGDAGRLIEGQSLGSLYLGLLTDSVDVPKNQSVDNTDQLQKGPDLFP